MAIIAYIRVSSADQNLGRQEEMARQVNAEKVFSEKVSGKNTERPQLKRMMEYLREGDTLHVESISSLARSIRDLLSIIDALRKKGVEFVSHKESLDTSTPTGRFMLTVFAALAELEREATALHREVGIAVAKKNGVKFGRPPVKLPSNWSTILQEYNQSHITSGIAAQRAGVSKSTFFRLIKESTN